MLVGTDYCTKWVEVEPLANIRDVDVKKFLWKNIVTRFGIPHTLISDNGLQFDSKSFRKYCYELGITNRYSTPVYPQGNGQAETVNKVIVNGLKKRLDDAKEDEWKNYRMANGRIEPLLGGQLKKPHFRCLMGLRLSSP